MNIIVTVDENWAIGRRDGLLARIPADWRNLQRLTAGGVLVMGRKTLESFPQGQPLSGRENIVLSAKGILRVPGARVVHGEEELFRALAGYDPGSVYVVGGESLFKLFLPRCDTVYVTMIEKSYEADRYFENLDKSAAWELCEESDEQTCFDITYYFRKYVRKNGG